MNIHALLLLFTCHGQSISVCTARQRHQINNKEPLMSSRTHRPTGRSRGSCFHRSASDNATPGFSRYKSVDSVQWGQGGERETGWRFLMGPSAADWTLAPLKIRPAQPFCRSDCYQLKDNRGAIGYLQHKSYIMYFQSPLPAHMNASILWVISILKPFWCAAIPQLGETPDQVSLRWCPGHLVAPYGASGVRSQNKTVQQEGQKCTATVDFSFSSTCSDI